MSKLVLVLGIFILVASLLLLLVSPFYLLFTIIGIGLIFMSERMKKQNAPTKQAPKRPIEEYTYITLDADEQDYDYAEKFYKENKEVLDENDDYNLPKKELLEYYSGKIYRYDPSDFDCEIKGKDVYDLDGHYCLTINDKDLELVNKAEHVFLVYINRQYKWIDDDDRAVYKEEEFPYFKLKLKIKKEADN